MTKVCHVTSVHRSNDIRIFVKECTTLAAAGYDMYLVAPGESRVENNVKITGCGDVPASRSERAKNFDGHVYDVALSIDADIYHFHDPEMLRYALKLKKMGKKIIFDSHEDVPGQIKSKPWIPAPFRGIVSAGYRSYETSHVRKFDAVITATDYIERQFEGRARRIVTVRNYPKLDDISVSDKDFSERDRIVCYAGGISHIRGEEIMVSTIGEMDNCTLELAGDCESDAIKQTDPPNTKYIGKIGRQEVNELYARSRVGICLLLPVPNYVNSLPTKIFEYMAAGLPSVSSNFPLCREILEKYDCGIAVDPCDHDAVVKAVRYYLDNPEEAHKAGMRGRRAIEEELNWRNEGKKLVELYNDIDR